jgi:hypothetical protein
MSLRSRPSRLAMLLCAVAVFALFQANGTVPVNVSADNTLSIDLLRAPSSTQPLTAEGQVQVNLADGKVTVELRQATPGSNYTAVFVSSSTSINLEFATIVTDNGGHGNAQGRLDSGTYVGVFEVLQAGLLQFTSAATSFDVGVTQSSTSISSESTENNTSVTQPPKFILQVKPVSNSIKAGDFAKFNIQVSRGSDAEASTIFLVAKGVPPHSIAIFTPNTGIAAPEFHSTLTVVTSANTPAANYELTVVARVNGQELSSQAVLVISAGGISTTSTAEPTSGRLFMTVSTDKPQYEPNATVTIQGQVIDGSGSAVATAAISVQVDSPTGDEVYFGNALQTDNAGTFQTDFTLAASDVIGTYTVFATASQVGYVSEAGRATFVVGSSSTPSVSIAAVFAGDSSGNPVSTVTSGQTIWIWVTVQNNGATFQGVVWVQVHDPNGVPVQIGIHIETLGAGQTIKDGIGFTLSGNAAHGVYRVDALVSDKLISQGGTFLAESQTQFALTG